MPSVFLPYLEVLWKCIPAPLMEIKLAGFDGVECHLIGRLRSPKRIAELHREAADLNLGIHFHQGWSWETGQPGFYNVVWRALGAQIWMERSCCSGGCASTSPRSAPLAGAPGENQPVAIVACSRAALRNS